MSGTINLSPDQQLIVNTTSTYDGVTLASGAELVVQDVQLTDAGRLTNAGTLVLDATDGGGFTAVGNIDNTGTILLAPASAPSGGAAGANTMFVIAGPTVTLSGGGEFLMDGAGINNLIEGAGQGLADPNVLINVDNTIAGGGSIAAGNGTFAISLTNESAGVIDANLMQGMTFELLTDPLSNAGMVEATNTGGLLLTQTTIDNVGGTVLAAGAGATVSLQSSSEIIGGVVRTTGGGVIQAVGGLANRHNTLDGSPSPLTIASGSIIQVNDNQFIDLIGTIVNEGTISLAGPTNGGELVINGPTVTLTGGGQIVLQDDGANNLIQGLGQGTANPNVLVNVNNTISGSGSIAAGNGTFALSLTNEAAGVIDANDTAGMTIELLTVPLLNQGLIEATGAGGMLLSQSTIDNAAGTILAAGAGVALSLQENSDISGGVIESTGGATIRIVQGFNNSQNTFDGTSAAVTIAVGTQVQVNDNQVLNLKGTIANAGTIAMVGTGGGGSLFVNSPTVTLTGGGEIVLDANANNSNFIGGNTGNGVDTLVNLNNLIAGSGQIATGNGANALNIDNAAGGTIESTGSLVIGYTITGAGTLMIDNGASMELTTIVSGQNVVFGGSAATLRLDKPTGFAGTIDGFAAGDIISFAGFYGDTTSTFDGSNLVVMDTGTIIDTFHFAGSYAAGQIAAVDNASGNVVIKEVGPSAAGLPAVGASFSTAVYSTLLSTLNAITPSGTTPNTVSVAAGGSAGSPVSGALNVLDVTTFGGGAALALPSGFQSAYLAAAGGSLIDTAGGAALVAAAANDTLIGAANDTLFGGNGNETEVATAGAETLYGGTGANLLELGSASVTANTLGTDTIVGSSATDTISAAGSPLFFGEGGETLFNALGASATLVGAGAETVNAGAANMLVFGGTSTIGGLDFVAGQGASTVVSYAGGGTLTGGSGATLFFGIGPTTYVPGSGADTVIGYGGAMTASGGSNNVLFFTGAAGGNVLSTGTGTSTIIGFGTGDIYNAVGAGNSIVEAAGASSTIDGAQSTGSDSFFAFAANDVVYGGAGNTAIESAFGNQTLIAGSGTTLLTVLDSGSNRAVTIEDFNAANDFVQLENYPAGSAASALQTATSVGGSEVLTLNDGTTVTFQGVTGLTANSFL